MDEGYLQKNKNKRKYIIKKKGINNNYLTLTKKLIRSKIRKSKRERVYQFWANQRESPIAHKKCFRILKPSCFRVRKNAVRRGEWLIYYDRGYKHDHHSTFSLFVVVAPQPAGMFSTISCDLFCSFTIDLLVFYLPFCFFL